MKNRSAPLPATICLWIASFCGIAHGITLQYWNASGTGGDGIWGTSPGEKNWNAVPGAPAGNIAWPDTMDDVAVFQDLIGGVVTLSDPLQAAGIIQNGANYSINAGVITLVTDSSAANPFINVEVGILTIDSVIAGNNGLIKDGGGTLLLTGSNTYDGSTRIRNGSLNLTGSLASSDVSISSGTILLNENGGLSDSAILTNAGTFTLNTDDTISSYISNGGTITAGPGTLFTSSAALNDGSTLHGQLNTGSLTSDGAVLLSGTATAGGILIQSGTLTLSGTLASDSVGISDNASLLNQNSGLSTSATLTNAGSLTLHVNDTVTNYISNGGILTTGQGALTTTNATLNDGSIVAGRLKATTLTSTEFVQVHGSISSSVINITSGTLTNTGTLGIAATLLNLNQGATLVAAGSQRYAILTTSGPGTATWRGDLKNTTTIAPGSLGSIGILGIRGNFTQSSGGTLALDLSAKAHDMLDISGKARFEGSLVLNQLGTTAIASFVPVTVVSASSYAGNFTSFSENLEGAVWFNPGNGSVTRIDIPTGGPSFFGSTRNQTSTWIALYDDVIAPGITNIHSVPGGHDISSGIADTGNPDLLWALSSSFTSSGLNAALLNRLSPEVYGGMSDYAMQATRSHQRSALSAPALDPREGLGGNPKDSTKAGKLNAAKPVDWEFFAAMDYFSGGTDNSPNEADYDFDGAGVLAGARTRPWERTQIAAYFGLDSGTINGNLIDADAFGYNLGVTGEYLLDEKSRTRLRAAMSYGAYLFDGSRQSVSATSAGWAPGNADFENLDVDAFDVFIGVDGIAWKKDELTLIPSAGLRYAMTTMDAFNESTGGAAGAPIALNVQRDHHESLLLEFGLLAQFQVNAKVSLWAENGLNFGLLDDSRELTASFAKGSRKMRANVRGLDDDTFYLGFGALYQINDNISASIGYRADIRSDAEAQQEMRISSSWRF